MKIRTITLEIVRHGPSHNQLLSPLTRYMGLCGNFGVTSIQVPFEHHEILNRLDKLRYQDPVSQAMNLGRRATRNAAAERQMTLEMTAKEITTILAANPGLASQLHDGNYASDTMVELQIVLSATELALLPFEIAKVPDGCIGSPDSWLGLQNRIPVCITRRTRTLFEPPVNWEQSPRILFISAGVPERLVTSHIHAMLKALAPWLPGGNLGEDLQSLEKLKEILTILPEASRNDIDQLCNRNIFTHVHVLAHGVENSVQYGKQVGLLLRNETKTGSEVVTASQLATALNTRYPSSCNKNVGGLPLIVTLASCEIAQPGDVIYSHGSFAHLLHEEGVPVVIGAQFPLSFRGSVMMTEALYVHFLKGEDPRASLHAARQKIYASRTATKHDWASLIGYIALPKDFSNQLSAFRYQQSKKAIDNALEQMDEFLNCLPEEPDYKNLLDRIDQAISCMPTDPSYETEVISLQGTIAKRKAQLYFSFTLEADGKSKCENSENCKKSLKYLDEAMRCYRLAASSIMQETDNKILKKRALHWSLTQYLVLHVVLFGELDEVMEKWYAASYSAHIDMKAEHGSDRQLWACASAMELNLLRYATEDAPTSKKYYLEAQQNACHIHKYSQSIFLVQSTYRQLQRYEEWWCKILESGLPDGVNMERLDIARKGLLELVSMLKIILIPGKPSCITNQTKKIICDQ